MVEPIKTLTETADALYGLVRLYDPDTPDADLLLEAADLVNEVLARFRDREQVRLFTGLLLGGE